MEEKAWLAVLVIFFAIPTILLCMRVYYDAKKYFRSGYLASSAVSFFFAILAYLFFVVACAMTLWRQQRRLPWMDRIDHTRGIGGLPPMDPLSEHVIREATIIHSYVVPTGLWFCKASFVAMYFNLKRHLNARTTRLLYFTAGYLIASYLLLVLTHGLWCGGHFGKGWADTSRSYCTPFASTLSISIYAFANISSDILVLAIPLLILHYITVLPRERYAIMFLLFLGLGTIVTTATCCGLHITYRHRLIVYYSYVRLAELLACIELSVAMSAVSLPSLKAVLYKKREQERKRAKSSQGESKRSGSRGGGNSAQDWYDEQYPTAAEFDEFDNDDQGRLVILRRVSVDVESIDLTLPPRPVVRGGEVDYTGPSTSTTTREDQYSNRAPPGYAL